MVKKRIVQNESEGLTLKSQPSTLIYYFILIPCLSLKVPCRFLQYFYIKYHEQQKIKSIYEGENCDEEDPFFIWHSKKYVGNSDTIARKQ